MQGRELPRALRSPEARDCQVWMKRTCLASETFLVAFIFQCLLQLAQLSRSVLNPNPKHARLSDGRKRASACDDQLEGDGVARGSFRHPRKGLDFSDRR